MKRALKLSGLALLGLIVVATLGLAWWWQARLPQRSGELPLTGLKAPVQVRYDDFGVPHIRAGSETDLYRALGYVHAQDRLFQMEILRRLARGELADILGPKLVDTDRLFRSLAIRHHADAYAARLDPAAPSTVALQAYLDGVNQYQANRPAPIEFALLGIPKRPFTMADTASVAGYLAYSFAAAFRTEPVLTRIRDELGAEHLRIFDLGWHPEGVTHGTAGLAAADWHGLNRLAALSHDALSSAGVPVFEGSNAWAISGARTVSGKPLLAGDPHIAFSVPAVWYEAHLSAPGFELYGLHQALNPFALVGHNQHFGWSLTMFQNDDIDLIAEKILLQKGDKMLDIGCGWGTLLYNSAKKYGAQVTGVTIAEQGYQYISEQIVKQKLQGKVNVLKIDYRDIPKQKFNKITCVEMAEHVGVKNFNKFMKQIYDLLDDDGIYYQQVAGLKAGLWNMESLVWGLFMNKYIFPGADASMPLKWYVAKLEKAKFEVRSVETIGIHYSRTLNQWHENWLSNEDKIMGAYNAYWFRLWDAFLAWSTNIAEEGHATCYQIVAHKNKPKFNRKRFIGKKTFA